MLRNYKDILLRTEARLRQKGDAGNALGSPSDSTLRTPSKQNSNIAISPLTSSSSPTPMHALHSTPLKSFTAAHSSASSSSSSSSSLAPSPCPQKKVISPLSIVLPLSTTLTSPGFTPRKLTARTPATGSAKRNTSPQVPPCKVASQEQSPSVKPCPRITPRKLASPPCKIRLTSSIPVPPFPMRDMSTPPTKSKALALTQQLSTSCRLFDESEFPVASVSPTLVRTPPISPAPSVDITPIKSLKSLLWCDFPPGSFVMLDLDETLIQTRHSPALLLSTYGARFFKGYVQTNVQGFKNKNAQIQKLQEALKDKVLVEGNITTNTIKELQSSGYWVFGLTTRYSSMADTTTEMLLKLGIDFTTVAPFPPTRLEDPMTGAVVANGVVYCNGFNKGFVLNRILENVVFGASLRILRSKGVWAPPKVVSREDTQSLVLPPLLVLVDDVRSNLDSMLEVSVAKMLRVPVIGFHFTPPHLEECAALRPPPEDIRLQDLGELALKVLMLQMEHLVEDSVVLSNSRALAMLQDRDSSNDTEKAEVVPLDP